MKRKKHIWRGKDAEDGTKKAKRNACGAAIRRGHKRYPHERWRLYLSSCTALVDELFDIVACWRCLGYSLQFDR